MKILVIEDDVMIRESICDLFEDEGFQVFASDNGLNGLEKAIEHLPNLIVSDIDMPKLSGHEVLFQLQSNSFTKKIPFVVLTASSDAETRDQTLKMGANAYLTKPCASRDLLEVVSFFLNIPISYHKYSSEH